MSHELTKRLKAKLTYYAIFYHSLTYTIPLLGYGQELVSNTYKSWGFLNKYHTLYQTIMMVCSAKATD